ncbi:MAG: Hpt domain-containing protein [Ktedonobacteraceae bacterium]|nr:Hpt domain-containing protein [Ktedonobacteraceae bacterium]
MSDTFDRLAVLDSFIEEVNSYLPEIETNLERLARSPGDMEALEETYRRAHTIGGSASMVDCPGLAHVAHGMEDILGDALDGLMVLDEVIIDLLRRSLRRMNLLLKGIRSGANEENILAEDDADYERYRTIRDSAAQTSQAGVASSPPQALETIPAVPDIDVQTTVGEHVGTQQQMNPSSPAEAQLFASQFPASPAIPSFEEVLASFRVPSVTSGEDLAWPEDPVPDSPAEEQASVNQSASLSAFDQLIASAHVSSSVQPNADRSAPFTVSDQGQQPQQWQMPVEQELTQQRDPHAPGSSQFEQPAYRSAPAQAVFPHMQEEARAMQTPAYLLDLDNQISSTHSRTEAAYREAIAYAGSGSGIAQPSSAPVADQEAPEESAGKFEELKNLVRSPGPVVEGGTWVPSGEHRWQAIYDEIQQETGTLEAQLAVLKQVGGQARSAISVIEAQRKEFKSFLDGSKDALDRMEEWAGKAMGLNLRNSPEQVRRYLPLSVMWVANSKLKKVFDLLRKIAEGIEESGEQSAALLQQFQVSLAGLNETFREVQDQVSSVVRPERKAGWTPWSVQVEHEPGQARQRVTFERQGDLAALRAELEAQLREEIRREYESQPTTLAARVELERQIREEVRQEFEARRRLQEGLSASEHGDVLRELEARLRSEIEIQVRQEFLSQISKVSGQIASAQATTQADSARHAGSQMLATFPSSGSPPRVAPPSPAPSPSGTGDFGSEAAEIFREEAEEHLQTISTNVAALEKDQTNRDLVQAIRRATHTLKGAAGMMGFRTVADLCHVSEDLLDSIMEGSTPVTPAVLSIILETAEALDVLITGRNPEGLSGEAYVQNLRTRYAELLGEHATALIPKQEEIDAAADESLHETGAMSSVLDDEQSADMQVRRPSHGNLSVHVRLSRLDELVNLFGELLVNRSVLEERIQRLLRLVADVSVSSNRLFDVGQKLESRFEAATLPSGRSVQVMPGEGRQKLLSATAASNGNAEKSYLAEFDELELDRYTEFHQLARGLSEGISDMATLSAEMDAAVRECEGIFARENRLSTAFQDRLMKVRLVPLSAMAPRLYRAARSVALKQNKEIEFVLEGESTEVDRTVFEEISGPLLHLVRNAVNHGIETPEVRTRRGKPAVGQIKLSAAYEGNQIVITVRDDGEGIDRESVRNTAIARGLIRPDQSLGEGEVIELIFQPGFSTARVLSEESGRGVGLDVVRDSVSRLRGKIVVESTPGQGTAFTMTFPTSLAIQNAMMVNVSNQQFAIPTVAVESIGRLDNFKRSTIGGQPAVIVQNEIYPLHLLSEYLSLPATSTTLDDKAQLLFVNTAGQRVALVVDEIIGRSDIVMKNLGPHLRDVHGIAGGTVLGNGRVVLVLELNDLLSVHTKSSAQMSSLVPVTPAPRFDSPLPQTPFRQQAALSSSRPVTASMRPVASTPTVLERGKHVLVVDDSPSVRRVVSNMLKQHGWEVQVARDGVEALEMITNETPAAVLLDIEMPRMDGYELISTVRAQEQYRSLPLVVLTSRAAAKHQQRAMLLGASAYIVKPYQDEELINILNSLVYKAAVR